MADEISTLNSLIETLKDGQNGFQTAAEDVKDSSIKATFNQFAQERAQMVAELQSHVRTHAEKPATTGSVAAAAHRGWMNLKSALGGGEKAILDEAERGEDVAVEAFEKALKEPMDPDASQIVRKQYGQVKQAHDRVKSLRDSWR
jgi:uncharacterized protein (TIGR02284 family)